MALNAIDQARLRAESTLRDTRDFESKYEARITDSTEYKQYVRRMPYNMWDGKIPFDTEVEVVPMKAIHLTRDSLERLMREQDLIDKMMEDAETGKRMWNKERTDRAVRESNPAVDKAYRNYQMLLELARK